jgi:hypothetical protein
MSEGTITLRRAKYDYGAWKSTVIEDLVAILCVFRLRTSLYVLENESDSIPKDYRERNSGGKQWCS